MIKTVKQWDNIMERLFNPRCNAEITDNQYHVTYVCICDKNHDGMHRSQSGIKWDDEPIKDYFIEEE